MSFPPRNNKAWVKTGMISSKWCVISTIVGVFFLQPSRFRNWRKCSRATGSRPAQGSSSIKSLGLPMRARPIRARWRSPWESWAHCRLAKCEHSIRFRIVRAARLSLRLGSRHRSIIAYLPLTMVSRTGSSCAINLSRAELTSPICLRS